MNDDDLRRLLRSIDSHDDDVPPEFADELWHDVRSTVVRNGPDARRGRPELFDLVEGSHGRRDSAAARSQSWLGRAAVLVLLVAGVVGIVVLRNDPGSLPSDEPTTTVTDPTIPTAPPVLEDPTEACLRFETAGPLAEADRRISDLETTVSVIAELDTAVAALEVYVRDLEAAADASPDLVTASDMAPFRRALDSLQQAQLEVEIGELDRAKRSVETATSLIVETRAPWC